MAVNWFQTKTWLQTAAFAPRRREELIVEATALQETHLKFVCRNCSEPCKPTCMSKTQVIGNITHQKNTKIQIQCKGSYILISK